MTSFLSARSKLQSSAGHHLAAVSALACALSLLVAVFSGCTPRETINGSQFNQTQWEKSLKDPALSEREFTRLYAQAVAAELKTAKVQLAGRRHLKVQTTNGNSFELFLDNAWTDASKDPALRPEVCRRYIASLLAAQAAAGSAENELPDTNSIVAVVRGQAFLDQFRKYQDTTNALVSEPLVADIYVLYACDSEQGISYLSEGRRKALGLELPALRELAMANLHRMLPSVKIAGSGPVFTVKADGTYESSLLLADQLWKDRAAAVTGDLVAAAPARDVLLFTGAGSPDGVEQIRLAVDKIHNGGSHLISKTLVVRRNEKWEEWK